MLPARTQSEIEEIARELDLLVFALELPRPEQVDEAQERQRVRRELDKLRERLDDLVRGL